MCKYNKTIIINEERAIRFCVSDVLNKEGEEVLRYTIEEFFMHRGIKKSYKIRCGDTFDFEGWINTSLESRKSIDSLSYDFDKGHPLYTPLLHMLQDDEKVVINDSTQKKNTKNIEISKEEDKISIIFTNTINPENMTKKFYVSLDKGSTHSDKSSKNIKSRLNTFFKEAIDAMYLISIENYVVNAKDKESEKSKQYTKTMVTNPTEAA